MQRKERKYLRGWIQFDTRCIGSCTLLTTLNQNIYSKGFKKKPSREKVLVSIYMRVQIKLFLP